MKKKLKNLSYIVQLNYSIKNILNVQKKKPVFHECRVLLAIIITV